MERWKDGKMLRWKDEKRMRGNDGKMKEADLGRCRRRLSAAPAPRTPSPAPVRRRLARLGLVLGALDRLGALVAELGGEPRVFEEHALVCAAVRLRWM